LKPVFQSLKEQIFKKESLIQMVKFGLVGIMNTLLSLAVIFTLYNLIHLDYRIANVAGYIAGLTNSFIWNRLWTFKSGGHLLKESALFLGVFGVCFAVQFAVLLLLAEILLIEKNISILLSMVIYTGINYLGNRFVTFRSPRNRDGQ
jgi:putative flippase GtrA